MGQWDPTDQAYQKKDVVCKKRKSNSLNGETVCTDKKEMWLAWHASVETLDFLFFFFFFFFCQIPVAIPDIRFKDDHFHYLISHDTRSTCKVHIQDVRTSYTCAICGVIMCPEPCFKRFHTMQDYYFVDGSYNGPRRLKEGGKSPFHRARRRSLRNWKLLGSLISFLNKSFKIVCGMNKLTEVESLFFSSYIFSPLQRQKLCSCSLIKFS